MAASAVIALLALTGCANVPSEPAPASAPEESIGDGHGEIDGARELAEPALHLTTTEPGGVVHHLDLLDEGTEVLAEIAPVDDVVTDGRYLFAIRDGSVSVIDSGVWTRSHGDHFHYYEAPSIELGEVVGSGTASVVSGDSGIGILFDDEAVLLDAQALADGDIVEQFRVEVDPHDGMLVPLTEGALLTEPGEDGTPAALRALSADGTSGARIECTAPAGTITTPVGVVVGCADGALLAVGGDAGALERIPYPDGTTEQAAAFTAREGRPSVAAIAGETGFWMLDTRERTWTLHDLGEEIARVIAVDDAEEHVLVLAADGSVLVVVDGAVMARTEPLVAASLADPAMAAHVTFVVDQQRAYLNGPSEQTMWEIDPSDGARIARVFDVDHTPLLLAGTGR